MDMVTVYIMGREYQVPAGLTIMKAMEYAGYRLIRGCGCRGGFCGGCGTIIRKKGSYKLTVGLACQTVVEDGMQFAQIPYYPPHHPDYMLENMEPTAEQILKIYPEVFRCLSCNSCSKVCPQDLRVMDYVQAALRGDIAKAADLSFDCLNCGLCATRCPVEIVQYNVGNLVKRLYSRYIAPADDRLDKRCKEIEENKVSTTLDGGFNATLNEMTQFDKKKLKDLYNARVKEPGESA
ncbi:MAG: 4Fe-4S dicluster domain-containing protein [Candidatus Coatesbacteria bacterium]|nr:4Fe-4S dicluster domain-containing protein [Candidatus Coatesbacteria bacterium]